MRYSYRGSLVSIYIYIYIYILISLLHIHYEPEYSPPRNTEEKIFLSLQLDSWRLGKLVFHSTKFTEINQD
jgi:hypothetical protein